MNVLYRVRPSRVNEELRFSLRSLSNLGDGRHDVTIVGSAPGWVKGAEVVPGLPASKWRALLADLYTGASRLSGEALLLDDDMFILAPLDRAPTLHQGGLDDRVLSGLVAGTYGRSLLYTLEYVRGLGVREPLDYELHVPLPFVAEAMVEALAPTLHSDRPLQARTVYGNAARIGGTRAIDVKLRTRREVIPYPFASTSEGAWRYHAPAIAALLPEPSPFE